MKLLFNKNIFKDKSFIKMICFTFVLILVLVLGNCFGFVSADEGGYEYCLNELDYSSSSIFNSSLDSNYERWYSRNNFSKDLLFYIQDLDFTSISSVDSNFDYSRVTHYMFFYNGGVSVVCYLFYAEPTMFYNGNLRFDTQMPSGYTDDCVYVCDIPFTSFGSEYDGHYYEFNMSQATISEVTLNNDRWVGIGNGNSYCYPLYGNIQYFNVMVGWQNDFSTIYDSFYNRNNSAVQNYWVNVNYFYGNASPLTGFDNLVGVSSGDPVETSSNNMYLDSCKFTFNFNPYVNSTTDDNLKYKGNWNKGNVTFDAILNDYQIENLDQFTLHIQWQVLIAGKGFYITENSLTGGYDLGTAVPFGGNYVMTSESTYSLNSFHSNGDSLSWNADTIYNSVFCDNSLLINYNHSLTSLLAQASEFYEIDWSSWKIYANAWLSTTTETSDKRIDSYNFLSGTSTNVSDSLNTNNNPYISGDDSSFFDSDDSNTTTQTTSNGSGDVTQTVTVNVDNSSSYSGTNSTISNLIDKLLGTDDDEFAEAGLTDQFTEATNSNGWLELMSATFGFVPNSVWNKLSITLVTVLGIMVVAFILRIILDLL